MPDDQLFHRVQRLEEGVDRLATSVDQQGAKFDSKLDSIGQSISLLVRIDERQVAIAERLQLGAATMQNCVVAGVGAGAGMIGVALLKLVVFT